MKMRKPLHPPPNRRNRPGRRGDIQKCAKMSGSAILRCVAAVWAGLLGDRALPNVPVRYHFQIFEASGGGLGQLGGRLLKTMLRNVPECSSF